MANQSQRARSANRVAVTTTNQDRFRSRIEEIATPHEASLLTLFIYVEGAGRHTDALMNRVVQKWELDSAQMSVLFALWCVPAPHRQSPTVLYRQLTQSPSGISHTLRRLTAAGLTRRIRDPLDRALVARRAHPGRGRGGAISDRRAGGDPRRGVRRTDEGADRPPRRRPAHHHRGARRLRPRLPRFVTTTAGDAGCGT